ncbi:Interferon-induced double-stranded RNA-activated protein kinase, partial [Dissostichus eleginoides]
MESGNYVGRLNEYAHKKRFILDYRESPPNGPDHCKTFTQRVVLNGIVYPEGVGKTKKEARKDAAKNALSDLSEGTNQHAVKKKTSTPSRFTSDFDPIEYLGIGGYGSVYKARRKLEEKYYAVKIVRSDKKAFREVGTLSDLLHHNVIRYFNCWIEDTRYEDGISAGSSAGGYSDAQSTDDPSVKFLYIQMELCKTKTLKEWINEKNTQSPQDTKRRQESLTIAQQIVSGVEYIHSKGHIHRDLKPDNILFGLDDKEVKIGDFGLVTRDDDALMDRTENRGTRSYMAPEQVGKTYDRKVDIFALGLIYLELLWKVSSGHERGEVLQNARKQILPTDFSRAYQEENLIIKKMLHEKPEVRPKASDLKAQLDKFTQRVVLNGKVYPDGVGKTKKEAKQDAAKNALRDLSEGAHQTAVENYNPTSAQQKQEPNQNDSDICNKTRSLSVNSQDQNFIGLVDHYCQKKNHRHTFIEERRWGPDHEPQLIIEDKEYPVAEGRTSKEAKQNAAKLAWFALQEQSDWDSKHPVKDKIIGNTENQTSTLSRFTDEFDVTECLGKGAYGCVYAARDKRLKQDFAVKIVRSNEKALREVGTLSKLLHCNIVRYYTFWMEDSRYQGHITAGNSAGSFSSSQSIEDPSAKYLYIQMELCKTKTLKKWINEKNAQSLQDSKRRQESVAIAQQIVSGVEYIHSMGHIHRDLKITGKTYDRKVDIFALGLIYFELLWKLSTGHERGV